MELPIPLAIAIQQGINTVLRLSPHTKKALSGINGKVIRVQVSSPKLVFHLIVVDELVDVEGGFDGEPDTTISGSATDLMSLRQRNDSLYTGAVKIDGDLATGEKLRTILSDIDIDFEEIIAPITGDAIAHQLGQFGSQLSAWFSETNESMKRNTSEYLQDEVEIIAPNSEIKRYCQDVDEMREKTDRLSARLDVLEDSSRDASDSTSSQKNSPS